MMLSVSIVLIFVFTLLAPPLIGSVFAEEEDGLYSIEYEVLKADSDSTSIGNDYFEKPATLIVEGGEKHIQLTVNHSDYVKSLSGPQGEVSIVSEDKEKRERVVKFEVDELSKPIEMEMHISFELEDQGYDQTHKARFDFNTDSMEPVGSKAKKADKSEATDDKDDKNDKNDKNDKGDKKEVKEEKEEQEENPPTSDNTPIALFAFLLIVSSLALIYSVRSARADK